LGLVARLHLQESLDVAIKMSDRFRHNKLSDCIEDEMQRRFSPHTDQFGMDDHPYDDGGDVQYDDRCDKRSSNNNSSSSQVTPETQPKRPVVQRPDRTQVLSNNKKRRFD
jgi:hypothetical protein